MFLINANINANMGEASTRNKCALKNQIINRQTQKRGQEGRKEGSNEERKEAKKVINAKRNPLYISTT